MDLYFFLFMKVNTIKVLTTYLMVLWLIFVPLLLFVLWFFTCKHWCIMYYNPHIHVTFSDCLLKLRGWFNRWGKIFWLLPNNEVIIPFVYFIRLKLFDRAMSLGIVLEAWPRIWQSFKKRRQGKKAQKEEMAKEKLSYLILVVLIRTRHIIKDFNIWANIPHRLVSTITAQRN